MPLFSQHTPRPPRIVRTSVDDRQTTASALLKRYRPLETRAAGGFGSVEVCLDARLQRRVAIKRMPLSPRYGTAPTETRETALAEARTASLLQHPNIVQVLDFAYDDAYAYLIMEYVDGMSLEEFLEQVDGHSLTYDECAAVADALVQAVAFAHDNGVLHLDIKPANVLIDRSGHVKITDFGMATLSRAAGFGGARGGTIGYMPPEQLAGEDVDERTDVFALAAVLYEALCATAPFRAGTPQDSFKRIKKGVLLPSSLLPDIPESAEEALLQALAPDAAERMGSVSAFGDDFLAHLGSVREGRRSLARMIARMSGDDMEEGDPDGGERRVWELDPAEGYLGSRSPRARAAGTGALAAVSVGVAAARILALAGVDNPGAQLAGALALGAASLAAPPLGSAMVAAGFAAAVAGAESIIAALPALALYLAVFCGWWYAWGRRQPAASAVFALVSAFAAVAGSAAPALGPAAAVAAYALAPASAAATVVVSGFAGTLLAAAFPVQGALGAADMLGALADPGLLAAIAAAAAVAAGAAALTARAWQRMEDGARAPVGMVALAAIVLGIVVVFLELVANPVENTGLEGYRVARSLGWGALSSIILCACIYLWGYRKPPAEGERA